MISQILWINAIIVLFMFAIFKYLTRNFNYWKKRNVFYIKPIPLFGNIKDLILSSMTYTEYFINSYWLSEGHRYYGIFIGTTPWLVINDPELVLNVMSRNFEQFYSKGVDDDYELDLLNNNLILTKGSVWRFWRANIASFFFRHKVTSLTSRVVRVSGILSDTLGTELKEIDIKSRSMDYATNIMGDLMVAFGEDQLYDPDSELKVFLRNTFQNSLLLNLRTILRYEWPSLPSLLRWKRFSKEDEKFIIKVVKNRVEDPEKEKYNDLLSHLICNQKVHVQEGVTLTELAANTYGMFAAGVETTGSVLAYTLYELAKNQVIQDKLHEEITEVLSNHDSEPTYAAVKEMKYLDQVLSESLRMYPSLQGTSRMCTKDYKIPDSDVVIEKGIKVLIPIIALHHDAEYFPDPFTFNPDRFNDQNKGNIVKGSYIPFGDGPRICIGQRLAKMEIKVALVTLLTKYTFYINKKMIQPLRFSPRAVFLVPKYPILLDVIPRTNS